MGKEKVKRKRGCNYTAQETNKLLDLFEKYKSSIEDKRTVTMYLSRKQESWKKICHAYNAVATSGIRTIDQLKIFYDNKKQKARKSLATHNKKDYIIQLKQQNVTEEDLKIALEHAKTDKGQWNKTGGGSWCPTVSENDQKILAIIKDQVKPLPNSFDSAAAYFKDIPNILEVQEEGGAINGTLSPQPSQNYFDSADIVIFQEYADQNTADHDGQSLPNMVSPIKAPSNKKMPQHSKNDSADIVIIQEYADHDGQSSPNMVSPIKAPSNKKIAQHSKNGARPRTIKKKRLVNNKNLYFKRKSQNALIQKRKFLLEIRLRQQEHQMFLKEHKLRMEHMQEEHDAKMKEHAE